MKRVFTYVPTCQTSSSRVTRLLNPVREQRLIAKRHLSGHHLPGAGCFGTLRHGQGHRSENHKTINLIKCSCICHQQSSIIMPYISLYFSVKKCAKLFSRKLEKYLAWRESASLLYPNHAPSSDDLAVVKIKIIDKV